MLIFERKLLLVKLQVQRSYPGPLCTWGFFAYSHLRPVSRMNWKVPWWIIAVLTGCLPAHSGIALPCSESAAGAWGTPGAAVWSTRVPRLPSPASSGSSSCVEEAQLPKTSTTTQTGCFYGMKLIFWDMEMPRMLRCRAIQSDTRQITVPELLNSQAFWINKNTLILAEKDIFHKANCSSESNAWPLLSTK